MSRKPKLKAKPDWDGDGEGGADRFAKFRSATRWRDYSGEDRLKIDDDILADLGRQGLDLSWIAESCMGQPLDYQLSQHTRNGWTRVEASDGIIDGPVHVDGLHLYCRPIAISHKSREHEARKAASVVATRRESLVDGNIPGVSLDSRHPSARRTNKINRTYERIDIPGDGD